MQMVANEIKCVLVERATTMARGKARKNSHLPPTTFLKTLSAQFEIRANNDSDFWCDGHNERNDNLFVFREQKSS
jgi:hypothetical protein